MPCLAETEIVDFLAGRLSAEQAAHVDACQSCRRLVAAGSFGSAATLAEGTVPSGDLGLSPTAADLGPPRTSVPTTGIVRGASIGRYVIVSVLGKGGMGVVYAAFDPELDRKVALKLLRPELAGGEGAAARLLREGRAVAKLAHPNVVAVFDVGTHDGAVFVAMELVDGRSLDTWIAAGARSTPEEEKRPWREVVDVFVQAGVGLAAAHAIGMVHRDFKPANVLLGNDGRARVTDFGLARILGDEPTTRSSVENLALGTSSDERLTRTGAMVGTPAYMSPEQFEAQELDARSDQFSFAVSLYEALYGERPFAGTSIAEIFADITAETVRAPPVGTTVPAWLRAVVLRGMRAKPDDRYPSLEAMLAELRRDPSLVRRRIALGGGIALLGGAAVATYVMTRTEAPTVDCGAKADRELAAARTAIAALPPGPDVTAVEKLMDIWRATSIQTCKKPNPDLVLRGVEEACLVADLDSYETMAVQLRAPTPGMLERLHEDFNAPASKCLEHKRKTYPNPLPKDPAKRRIALDAREKYLRSTSNRTELTVEQNEELAREAVKLAEESGHDPTIANAYSTLGGALLDRSDSDGAIGALQKAITFAERGEAFARLAFSHVLLANVICNDPVRARECEAEIDRAKSYFDKHPEEQSAQFEITYAGYEAARLRPEVGSKRLYEWIDKHPQAATAPYLMSQLSGNETADGRPGKGIRSINAGLEEARKSGPPALVAELVSNRCLYEVEVGTLDPARTSLTELTTLATSAPELTEYSLNCEARIAYSTGDYARLAKVADALVKHTEGGATGWSVSLLLMRGRLKEARALVGPPGKPGSVYDWSALGSDLGELDFALAARDYAAAKVIVARTRAGLSPLSHDSYTWFDLLIRQATIELATGQLDEARVTIDHADALLVARGADSGAIARLTVGVLAAELCRRSNRGTDCGARINAVRSVVDPRTYEGHVAALLAADLSNQATTAEMCAEWKWLQPYRATTLVQALDPTRFTSRCR